MKKLFSFIACAGAMVAAMTLSGPVYAKYPARPITMIVAYDAGGGTDVAARTLVPYIEKYLGGGTITVVNRPGASGVVGFTALSRAKPDGYTIGFINTPSIMTAVIEGRAPFTMKDFAPIANVVSDPDAFNVRADSNIKSLKDLVKYAKAHPGAITFGTTGIGSDDQLAALAFQRLAGIKMTHVPFSGNAPVDAALLGGHIKMAVTNISESIENIREGRMRALGQMGEKRWSGAPKVPTFKEQGYDVFIGSDRGIAAPAGLPNKIKAKLNTAIRKAIHDPGFRKKAKKQDLPLNYLGSKDFSALINKENTRFEKLWKQHPWIKNQ
jgi:tripartite-type tricarboxylate transporter receptor subunit TctC